MITTLEIPIHDAAYPWVLEWLAKQDLAQPRHRGLLSRINPSPPSSLSVNTRFKREDNGSTVVTVSLRPGMGSYLIKYHNSWIQVTRSRETRMTDNKTGTPWETIQLRTLSIDRDVFEKILTESQHTALENQVGKTVVYTCFGHEWRPFGQSRKKRLLSSVILDDGISETLLDDIKNFLENAEWYYERGIPYRRGYLLHGPPGTGKTSFIQALAGELNYNVCMLNLSERGLTDDRLAYLLCNIPMKSILVLEDVDCLFRRDGNSPSGLLNAIDGIASGEERIMFMTTNHVEKLDHALIRPGRVDIKQVIDNASDYQIRMMFERFYGNSRKSSEFVSAVRNSANGREVSTAQLQGHLIIHRDNPDLAMKNANQIFVT